jgi:uncharacterized iron-regulated protein
VTTSAHVSQQTVESFYDYQLYSPSGAKLKLTDLPREITEADVVLVGEWHTHSAVHRFQTDLLKQLSLSAPNTALSMEQFSRDKQPILDSYLSGDIGEQTLIKQANAWPNYESDYRPLVELAKTRELDIIAANAPKPIVRCIGREGLTYLDKLDSTTREQIARSIDLSSSPYKDKFMASMHHGTPEQTNKQYAAQVTWDETMAESIVDYLAENSATKVLHIAGKFHIEEGLGTKAAILKRNPNLKVVVITPSSEPSIHSGNDYLLHVLSPPARYVQKANRMHAYKALGKRNDQLTCE